MRRETREGGADLCLVKFIAREAATRIVDIVHQIHCGTRSCFQRVWYAHGVILLIVVILGHIARSVLQQYEKRHKRLCPAACVFKTQGTYPHSERWLRRAHTRLSDAISAYSNVQRRLPGMILQI